MSSIGTADHAGHPGSVNAWYAANLYFSHWYLSCPRCGGWQWDSGGGTLRYDEQLSEQQPIQDKWDTTGDFGAACCANIGSKTYPSKSAPAGASAASEDVASRSVPPMMDVEFQSSLQSTEPGALPASLPFGGVTTQDPGEIRLEPDLSDGLQAHAREVRSVSARAVARHGSEGIVTFNRPVSSTELARISTRGVTLSSLEAIGYSPAGERWTFGAAGPTALQLIHSMAADEGVTIDGVVAASVRVADDEALNTLQGNPVVFLVDLSVGYAKDRLGSAGRDVVANDLYWHLAGWIPPSEGN
jgi:hypothetical protein